MCLLSGVLWSADCSSSLVLCLSLLQLLPRCSKEQVLGQMKDLMASLLKVRHLWFVCGVVKEGVLCCGMLG